MSKTLVVYVGVAIATLLGHYTLWTQRRISDMEFLLNAADQKEKIQDDQVNELIASLQQANRTNDSYKTEGYVAGMLDVINKPDHYMSIWHNGYDRGSAVQTDMMNVSLKLKPVTETAPQPTPLEPAIPANEKK